MIHVLEMLRSLPPVGALSMALFATPPGVTAGQIASGDYFTLKRGMSESEVLVRVGPPDLVTRPGREATVLRSRTLLDVPGEGLVHGTLERYSAPEIKELHYIPDHAEHDPHLTVITIRAGEVWSMERTKLLTRPRAPGHDVVTSQRLSDAELRVHRAERVLEAATAYAQIRERLGGDDSAATAANETSDMRLQAPVPVFRGVDEQGVPYFGDRPLEAMQPP